MSDLKSIRKESALTAVWAKTLEDSQVVAALRSLFHDESRTVATAKWVSSAIQASSLVHWLTAEPDPDVIVIDLRETVTVGPFIALLDRLVPHVASMWNGSSSKRALDHFTTAFRRRPVQLSSVFLICVLLVQLLKTWGSASTTSIAARLLIGALALVGLRVTWTWDELIESRVGQLAEALLVPPEPPTDEE